jgi:hypothetical protein
MDQPAGAPAPDGVQPPVSSWPKYALWSAAAIIVLVVAGMLYTWGLVEIKRCFNEAAIFCNGVWPGPEAAIAVFVIVAIGLSIAEEWRQQVFVFVGFIWQKYLVEPSTIFLLFMLVVAAIVSSFVFLVYLSWGAADILYKALSYADYEYCSTINTQEFFICDKIYYMKRRLHEYFALLVFVMAGYGLSKMSEIVQIFKGQIAKLFQPAANPAPGPRMQGPDPAIVARALAPAEGAQMEAEMPEEVGELA